MIATKIPQLRVMNALTNLMLLLLTSHNLKPNTPGKMNMTQLPKIAPLYVKTSPISCKRHPRIPLENMSRNAISIIHPSLASASLQKKDSMVLRSGKQISG